MFDKAVMINTLLEWEEIPYRELWMGSRLVLISLVVVTKHFSSLINLYLLKFLTKTLRKLASGYKFCQTLFTCRSLHTLTEIYAHNYITAICTYTFSESERSKC